MFRSMVAAIFVLLLASVLCAQQESAPANKQKATQKLTESQSKALPGTAASLSGSLKWRLVGPFRGGRSIAAAGVPGQPNLYYFGAAAGGVWRSGNGGSTWVPLFDSQPVASIGAIAVSDSNPNVIYVGTGESCIRGDISFGNGVYKSTDGGQHWTNVGLKDTEYVAKVVIDPTNPDVVLVAALGHAWGANPERGVFRTGDGGKTWQKVLYKDDHTGAIDLVLNPQSPSIIYAALWRAQRSPWHLDSGGPGSGIYKSIDGGVTWKQLEKGLPKGPLGRIGLAVSAAQPGRIYALVEAQQGGLYRSEDGGESWQLVNADHRFRQRPWYFSHVFADPQNADRVYILNVQLFRSTDGGKIFSPLKAPHSDYHDLWIDPKDPRRMIVANDGGVSISTDDGKTWSSANNQPTGQFYHVSTDNRFDYHIYGSQQDSGTVAIASRSDNSGIGEPDWYSVAGGESGFVFPLTDDPDVVVADSYQGSITRYDRRTGEVGSIAEWPENTMGYGAADLKYRFQWTAPIALSPHDPNVIYHAAQVLFKSSDRGSTWSVISPDLTKNDASKQQSSGGPITQDNTSVEYYDTIFAISESPVQKDLIWVGTDDGLIQITRNGGKNWTNITPKDLPAWCTVETIDLSSSEAGSAWVAVDCHRLDNFRPYIFHTTDFGKTWRQLASGIPEQAYVHAVREDPLAKGLVFAGTETGIYCSRDNGEHWESLQLNLPPSPVYDLTVHKDDLVAATHGRSFWVLDDISPLRQSAATPDNPEAYLFRPTMAYRLRPSTGKNTGPNAGKNPPRGAIIDYWLKEVPKDPVKLEIGDSKGTVVRTVTWTPPAAATEKEKQPEKSEEEQEEEKAQKLPVQAGANRFVWNLRYQNPARVAGIELWGGKPQGPLAPAGQYQIRLEVEKHVFTQPLTLQYDPRAKTEPDDLQSQFALARDISGELDKVDKAANRLISLRSQLEALKKRLGTSDQNRDIVARVNELDGRLQQALYQFVDPESKAEEDPVGRPVKIDSKLVYLQDEVEGSAGKPTPQCLEVFRILKEQAEKSVADELNLESEQVSALNKFLSERGILVVQPAAESEEQH